MVSKYSLLTRMVFKIFSQKIYKFVGKFNEIKCEKSVYLKYYLNF